jgi:hypothetical protein
VKTIIKSALIALAIVLSATLISCGSSGANTPAELPATKAPDATAVPAATAEAKFGIPTNPVPFGRFFILTRKDSNVTFQLGIADAYRGEKASNDVKSASTLNIDPAEGMEYIFVGVKVDYVTSGDPNTVLNFSTKDFLIYSKGAIIPNNTFVFGVKPILEASLKPGEKAEGWIVMQVNKDDPTPLVVYRPSFGMTGEEYYFAVQ